MTASKKEVKNNKTLVSEKKKAVKKELSVEETITKERLRLSKIYLINKEKLQDLINNTAFLKVLLENIENELKTSDILVETVNATQSFVKGNPLLKEYRDTLKSYQLCLKQLDDSQKDGLSESTKKETDPLLEFNRKC